MKHLNDFLAGLMTVFVAGSALAQSPSQPVSKPFRRALVMVGAGMEWPLMVGAYDGLVNDQVPRPPDLIIGTCGSAMAAAVIQAFPDAEKRKEFLKSERMHQFMRSAYTSNYGSILGAIGLTSQFSKRKKDPNFALDYWGNGSSPKPLLCVGDSCGFEELKKEFDPKASPRAIVIASRLTYGPEQAGKVLEGPDAGTHFIPTYITDTATAELLKHVQLDNPNVGGTLLAIAKKTEVVTGWTLDEAARASVGDPFLVQPFKRGEHHYMGGVVNLMPVELAKALADEVIITYREEFNSFPEYPSIVGSWGFDPWERQRIVHATPVDTWIDTSDLSSLAEYNFEPDSSLKSKTPERLEDYIDRIERFYRYGWERAQEGLSMPAGDLRHIRWMTKNNTQPEILKKYGRDGRKPKTAR